MRIKKILDTIGVVGNVLNKTSNSKIHTYSCDYLNKKILSMEGKWTPSIGAYNEDTPNVSYIHRRGFYKKIGNLIFVEFYIRGKISELNGSVNYAMITGLPFAAHGESALGQQALSKGVIYNLLDEEIDVTFCLEANTIRIMKEQGTSAASMQTTPSDGYFDIGGSGCFIIE